MSSSLIEIVLDVECIFSRLQKGKSAVENVRVKYLSYDAVYEPHTKCLMNQISFIMSGLCSVGQESSIVHFEYNFHLHTNGKYDHGHDKIDEQGLHLFVFEKFQFDGANTLQHGNEQLFHMVIIQWKLIEVAQNCPIHKVAAKTN